jgi:valyl-tRNA synthetase
MIELEKAFEAKNHEDEIYNRWESSGAFRAEVSANKEAYTISMPPPNATGTLHLGHAVMLAIEDILIRRERMRGKSALYLPGTDHASIATQSVVEKRLQDSGIRNPRQELGREKFLAEVATFTENSKDTIRRQVRKMGTSCDWSREKYTLDEDLNKAVKEFFGLMFDEGLIYQGDRIVNWDPKMQTTVADDELEYEEKEGILYHIQYGPLVVATSRPETKLGDTAVCVNPKDSRWSKLIGQEIEVEFARNHKIKVPVIADESIDIDLGSGALGVTPAHSLIDFELAEKHKIAKPQVIDFDGKITEIAGPYAGMELFECRKALISDLESSGKLVKTEKYIQSVPVNYRGKGVIEPQIMKQWFIDVNKPAIDWKGKTLSIKEVLKDTVNSGMIEIIPNRFNKTYFHWIDNLRDWCISRQIWWGHQIPVFYKVSGSDFDKWQKFPEASSFTLQTQNIEILETKFSHEIPQAEGEFWIQDPDTLDTWFSSSLWTFSTLGWPEKTPELEYFHPTSVLETGYDILFFWVARMILASTFCLRKTGFTEEKSIPFRQVYLHGLIRDIHGKKMSKSRPETCIDPLEMIDKYGTDAVRLSLVIGSTPGNDMRLYEEKIAGYRNFVNKIWNAARFALMNVSAEDLADQSELQLADLKEKADFWILHKLDQLIIDTNKDFDSYHLSEAANKIYNFTWGDFCDWYLEISKVGEKNTKVLLYVLKSVLKLLHPYVPFVTESIWQHMSAEKMLISENYPEISNFNVEKQSVDFEVFQDLIREIRSLRAEKKIDPAKKIKVTVFAHNSKSAIESEQNKIKHLARIEELNLTTKGEKPEKTISGVVHGMEIFIHLDNLIDVDQERKKLQKEIELLDSKINLTQTKLANQTFIDKAPKEVVSREKEFLNQMLDEKSKLEKQLREINN